MKNSSRGTGDGRSMCVSLASDFCSHSGQRYLPGGGCCDTAGCVVLFERIAPKATAIGTYSGAEADIMYRKEGKAWNAFRA